MKNKMAKKNSANPARRSKRQLHTTSLLMIGGILLLAVVILAGVWFVTTPNQSSGGTPQLQVSTERVDLGKQIFDRPVRASFTIKNSGDGTLTLNVPRVATVLEGC